MKALLIETCAPMLGSAADALPSARVACLYADSAIGRDAMPLFLPAGRWHGRVHLALRVGRLGKSVSAKFADRYIDAYGAVLIIYNVEDDMQGAKDSQSCRGCFMDSAITTGQWIDTVDTKPIEVRDGIPLTDPDIAGHTAGTIDVGDIHALARKCVPLVTRDATIKTGDLLITDRYIDVDLRPNTYVCATGLKVKVK